MTFEVPAHIIAILVLINHGTVSAIAVIRTLDVFRSNTLVSVVVDVDEDVTHGVLGTGEVEVCAYE